jgi:exodeoxyribonuclease V alpha subunit
MNRTVRAFVAHAELFVDAGLLTSTDVYAVALAAPRFGEADPERMLGLCFAVRAPRVGHAGVDLATLRAQLDQEAFGAAGVSPSEQADDEAAPALPWPEPGAWQERVLASPMVGEPDELTTPFVRQILAGGVLLLTRRMYAEQARVARALLLRASERVASERRLSNVDAAVAALFADAPDGEAARAVRLAERERLALIVGGPGTGKTFSITRLLAALLAEPPADRPLSIVLAAPTGKAAVRMRDAIREATALGAVPELCVTDEVRRALQALEAKTLHKLLGVRPDGSARHSADNPVAADVIVVDEASMIDLVLMRQLVEGVDPEARLVLLGDRDQLASVEAGSVLGDLVDAGATGPLAAHIQPFTRSHRFESAPEIALVAACLQSHPTGLDAVPAEPAARTAKAAELLLARTGPRITWLGPPELDASDCARPSEAQLTDLVAPYLDGVPVLDASEPAHVVEGYAALLKRYRLASGHWGSEVRRPAVQRALLEAFDRYRVLAAHRRGPLGVEGLDRALGDRVRAFLTPDRADERYWVGRPLLITENAYDLGLMNGDVGLVLPTEGGPPAVVFPHDHPDKVHFVALSRLPAHEGALAMTVHKSQGSQFDRVALVLAGRPSPIQTRELLYTGVTRAKRQLAWLGTEAELREGLARCVTRASGLGGLLGGT